MGKIEVFSVADELADAIRIISDSMEDIENAGLTENAIVVLLQDSIGVHKITKSNIRLVLKSLKDLERNYLK